VIVPAASVVQAKCDQCGTLAPAKVTVTPTVVTYSNPDTWITVTFNFKSYALHQQACLNLFQIPTS